MATAPKPAPQSSEPKPDATNTSVWKKLFGGGGTDTAAKEIKGRKQKLDEAIDGYKSGGLVIKQHPKATPYKCGGKVK